MKLLIVDDERISREGLVEMLDWKHFDISEVELAMNGQHALEIIDSFQPDIMITDIKMPKMDGLQLIAEIRERNLKIQVIVLSAYGEFEYAKKAMAFKVNDYILKPVEESELKSVVDKVTRDMKKAHKEYEDKQVIVEMLTGSYQRQEKSEINFSYLVAVSDRAMPRVIEEISVWKKIRFNGNYVYLFRQTKEEHFLFEKYQQNTDLSHLFWGEIKGCIEDIHHSYWEALKVKSTARYWQCSKRNYSSIDQINKIFHKKYSDSTEEVKLAEEFVEGIKKTM